MDNFLYGGVFQDTIKLSDLGLAVRVPARGWVKGASTVKAYSEAPTRGVSGTAPYMSPEMLMRKRYSTQTDVWSFASTVLLG